MPLQDLTPELRTRLSAVEKTVGWFVIVATIILLAGFGYYIFTAAKAKGWFLTKINFATGVNDATGLKPGDSVKLMGFDVGEIIAIVPNDPVKAAGVTVFFNVRSPYYGYIWLDSAVKLNADFLGHTTLEILKGKTGAATAYDDKDKKQTIVLLRSRAWQKFNLIKAEITNAPENKTLSLSEVGAKATNQLKELLKSHHDLYYVPLAESKFDRAPSGDLNNYIYVPPVNAPTLSDQLAGVANSIAGALPNILNLTNQLTAVLNNAAAAVARLDSTLEQTHPMITNLTFITGNLRDPNGSLGNWLIPTNLTAQLHDTLEKATATLDAAHSTLDNADTNLTGIATDLDHTLEHLSDLTSNLAWQVQVNTNLVTDLNSTIIHTDDLIQGLKRHWLLRSAFKTKATNKVEKTRSR